ncbi:MAG: low molecular weight protein-tyrosine-phosphatase [Lepagella sp.]
MNYTPRPTLHGRRAVAAAVAAARAEQRRVRLLFVCLGNICRSPAAQGITEHLAAERGIEVECDSAGFYGGHAGDLPDSRMRNAAYQRGYRLEHRARKIHGYDLDDFDLVIGMDDQNMSQLHQLADTDERDGKVVAMIEFAKDHPSDYSVPDPYYEGVAGFYIVLDLLADACSTLLDLIEMEQEA